jgi:hypothetical protein
LRGVTGNVGEAIKRGDAARLVFNTFLSEPVSYSTNITSYSYNDKKTLLYNLHKIERDTGAVMGTGITAIPASKKTREGYVYILGIKKSGIFLKEDTSADAFLGYNIYYYYIADDNEDVLVLVIPNSSRTSEIVIDSDMITGVTLNSDETITVKYMAQQNNSAISNAVIASDVEVIYNGIYNEFKNEITGLTDPSSVPSWLKNLIPKSLFSLSFL